MVRSRRLLCCTPLTSAVQHPAGLAARLPRGHRVALLEGRVSPTLFADAAGAILSRMLDAIPFARPRWIARGALGRARRGAATAAADGVVSPGVREHDGVAATVDVARRRAAPDVARSWLSEARRSSDEQEQEGAPPLAEPRAWRSASGCLPLVTVPLSDDDDSEDGVDTATGSAPHPAHPHRAAARALVSSRRSPARGVPLEEAAMARHGWGTSCGMPTSAARRSARRRSRPPRNVGSWRHVRAREHESDAGDPALAAAVVATARLKTAPMRRRRRWRPPSPPLSARGGFGSQSGRSLLARSGMPLDPGSNGTAEAPAFVQRRARGERHLRRRRTRRSR